MSSRGRGGGGTGGGGARARAFAPLPQEVVTPTRRDRTPPSNVHWVPVSEVNSRVLQNRSRKTVNTVPENNEFADIDANVISENSNRFVPVRPQPRTLGLRHRDNIVDNTEDSSYNVALNAHSPHMNHTAVMIVNPTTPNCNQTTHNMTSVNGQSNGLHGNRNISVGRETNVAYTNNTVPVGPLPLINNNSNKSNNILHENNESIYSIGMNQCNDNQHADNMSSRTRAVRSIGDSIVSCCPDTSRVEQRLEQIQEYIQVTANLVESMRNSEDELRERLSSLRSTNQMLMEGVYQDQDQEHNGDTDDLVQTLNDLKDSEQKLKDMLNSVLKLSEATDDDSDKVQIVELPENELDEVNCAEQIEIDANDNASNEKNIEVLKDGNEVVSDSTELNESLQDVARSCSVQSGGSMYSDYLLNVLGDLGDEKMDSSHSQRATLSKEQKYLLKCQAETKEQFFRDMNNSRSDNFENSYENSHPETINYNINQPLSTQLSGRAYASNQIGVATTLPHGDVTRRSRDIEVDHLPSLTHDLSNDRSKRSSSLDLSQMYMLRDLKMRRQHIENQVARIQNLQVATASLSEVIADSQQSGLFALENDSTIQGNSAWEGSEGSIADEDGTVSLANLKSQLQAVNVVKAELEKLKGMLRTVDSIENSFGLNSGNDDDHLFENSSQITDNYVNHNGSDQRGLAESPFNNMLPCKLDPVSSSNSTKSNYGNTQPIKNQNASQDLPRLQNYISPSSNKCSNVNDQHESLSSGIAIVQQLTQQMKQQAQAINSERQRLKQAVDKEINSSTSSVKSDEKKRTNSVNKDSQFSSNYPTVGPIERKQIALKAELEAKKKQLERLMSKEVDHRTNQQSLLTESDITKNVPECSNDKQPMHRDISTNHIQHSQGSLRSNDDRLYSNQIRSEVDNVYSSDPDEDFEYPHQLNINQVKERCSHKLSSQSASENSKMCFGETAQSLENNTLKLRGSTHANIFSNFEKQRNDEPIQMLNTMKDIPTHQEISQDRRSSKDLYNVQRSLHENVHDTKNLMDTCQIARGGSQECDNNHFTNSALPECVSNLSVNSNNDLPQKKQQVAKEPNLSINNQINLIDPSSRPDSGSSSGDRELSDIPHPMPTLPLRLATVKNEQDHDPDAESQPWQNSNSESQVTMWWHNKANQLQQQLEMTSNLCQTLLQERRTSHSSLSTLNSLPQAIGNPNFIMQNTLGLPNQWTNVSNDQHSTLWWNIIQQQQLTLQQQQLAAQQQQLTSASWGNNQCLQHLLFQQREISSLKSVITMLEEKLQMLNVNMPRSHSTPPNADHTDNAHSHTFRSSSALSRSNFPWNSEIQASLSYNHIGAQQMNSNASSFPLNPMQNNTGGSNLQDKNPHSMKKFVPPHSSDQIHNQLPANYYFSPFANDQMSNYTNMSNLSLGGQPIFNNCAPHMHLNPNLLSNYSASQPIQNNINPNLMLNLSSQMTIPNTHPITLHPMNSITTQTLSGQNIALNNQVPPGNRANNYWDNFRSYSRQNLLSGSHKANAENVHQSHSPHPLVERSHNALHSSSTSVIPQIPPSNTPKRNVNNSLGNVTFNQFNNPHMHIENAVENSVRSRRNLANESNFHAPPDVLNVNQNVDTLHVNNATEEENTRVENSMNININKHQINANLINNVQNPNINVARSNGALKKKTSKISAKNTSNYTIDNIQNKEVLTPENNLSNADPNITPISTSVNEKSTSKLFDLLRENVYSEVSALISANKSRPHFLIQLFRDLQQISSDTLRQRTLQSIQELVTRYLSNAPEMELCMLQDNKVERKLSSASASTTNASNDLGIFTLDVNNEIIQFLFAYSDELCSSDLMKSLRNLVCSIVGNVMNESQLDQCLIECFNKYPRCKLVDISDELVMSLSKISIDKPVEKHPAVNENNEQACGTSHDVHESQPSALTQSDSNAIHAHCESSRISQHGNEDLVGCPHHSTSAELKIDLIENVEGCNADLAEADQSCQGDEAMSSSVAAGLDPSLPDIIDMDEQTPTEAEAEWLRMDRVPTHLDTEDHPGNQSDPN